MTLLINVHIITALIAIISGFLIVCFEKGTRKHTWIGRVYFLSMSLMAFVSFGINELTNSFSIFHLISIQSLLFLLLGVGTARFLRDKLSSWQIWHGRFMVYSYITLLVTGTAQFFERLPFENTALRAIVFLTLPAVLMWAYFEFRFARRLDQN